MSNVKEPSWADEMEPVLSSTQKHNTDTRNPAFEVLKKLYPMPPNPSFVQQSPKVGGRTTARKPPTEEKINYKKYKMNPENYIKKIDLVKLITNLLSGKFADYGGFGNARCKKIMKGNLLFEKKELHWVSWQKCIKKILDINNKNLSNLEDYYACSELATEDKINEKMDKFIEELPLQITIFEASLTREEKKTKINDTETINILNIDSFDKALEVLLEFATIDWSS